MGKLLKVLMGGEKTLNNFRTKNLGVQEALEVPRIMELEDALDYIGDDELVEVTPKGVRVRKMALNENDRKRTKKQKEAE